MIITWYGQSCFKLQDDQQIILLDPYSPRRNGLRGPNLKATVVVLTDPADEKTAASLQNAEKNKADSKDNFFLISGAGEYEIGNIFIYGFDFIRKEKRKIIYRLEMEGLNLGFLGEIDSLLSDSEMEELGNVDVLFIPVGGKNSGSRSADIIDSKKAIEIIDSLEPRLVIPSCFKIPGAKTDLTPLNQFLQQAGIKNVEKFNKLSLHKKNLLSEQTKIIVLEPGG